MTNGIPAPIIIATVFGFAVPIGLLIWWKIKNPQVSLWAFIVGALCFVLFAMVLENILHSFCLVLDNSVSRAINGSPLLLTLYASFAAGIFEETGRLFGFKLLLRRQKDKATAVAYGIGHGGIEVIIILGVSYLYMLLACAGISMDGSEEVLRQTAYAIPMGTVFIAILERVSALMAHIGLSMLVFKAARDKSRWWLFPVAICLHALLDAPAMLFRLGMLSVIAVEAAAFVMGAAFLLLGIRVLYRDKTEESKQVVRL